MKGRRLNKNEEEYLADLLAASKRLTHTQKMDLMVGAPDIYWSLSRLSAEQEARELVQRELQGMRTRKRLGGYLRRNKP